MTYLTINLGIKIVLPVPIEKRLSSPPIFKNALHTASMIHLPCDKNLSFANNHSIVSNVCPDTTSSNYKPRICGTVIRNFHANWKRLFNPSISKWFTYLFALMSMQPF